MKAIRLLLAHLGRSRARQASPAALADFLAKRAAFVSQKSTVEYCRARAGINWDKLFLEHEFTTALERGRWDAYTAVLEDLVEVALVFVRRHGAAGPSLAERMAALGADALRRYPVPAHLDSWDGATAALEARAARTMMAQPRPVRLIAATSAGRVFSALPIHTSLRRVDREVVGNSVAFLLCGVYDEMERELDGPALAAALSAPA